MTSQKMMHHHIHFISFLLCLSICDQACSKPWLMQPEQVHLSWPGDASQMWVSWVTLDEPGVPSQVNFGVTPLMDQVSLANSTVFRDEGSDHRNITMHRAIMKDLKPMTYYYYNVGTVKSWSSVFYFKTFPGNDWSPRIAVLADFGNEHATSLGPLQLETQRGQLDMVWHIGDLAYNLATDNAKIGDLFMRQMEPVAAYVPYQVAMGNHEADHSYQIDKKGDRCIYYYGDNHPKTEYGSAVQVVTPNCIYSYANYRSRFTMPENGDGPKWRNMYYSYNLGPAHIIVLNSEFYYYKYLDDQWTENVITQYIWLVKDLEEATKPHNRELRPWIIVMAHKPLYCSNKDDSVEATMGEKEEHKYNCTQQWTRMRRGIQIDNFSYEKYGWEDLFYKYNVDLYFAGHEHSYERMWPTYNMQVLNGTTSANPYHNARATVHIVEGSAGCCYGTPSPFTKFHPDYSAKRSEEFGYGHLDILNKTHMSWEQVSVLGEGKPGPVVDKILMVKDKGHHFFK